ncbi:hypothetical protein ACWGR4_46040 [Embleya sp. NPDC055664]
MAHRKPATDILAVPTTGIGFFAQREWVTLPGDNYVTLDAALDDTTPTPTTSGIAIDAPALQDTTGPPGNTGTTPTNPTTHDTPETSTPPPPPMTGRWRPLAVTTMLDRSQALDDRILRILDGEESVPHWWPRDDSGYAITKRDLEFLRINPIQIKWMLTGEAPMGMTPALYQRFAGEMLRALGRNGIHPSDVDIRLKGTGAGFFSGSHKTLPREQDLAASPEAAERLREWLSDGRERPLRRPYDLMWRLGLEPEPSDFDLDINSTAMVRAARAHWRARHPDRYPGDFMGGHGYLDKHTTIGTFQALAQWAAKWEKILGRPLSLGVFESSGPFDATRLGRELSSHFRETDWIIHRPDTPKAWRTPRSRITPPAEPARTTLPPDRLRQARNTLARVSSDLDRDEILRQMSARPHGEVPTGRLLPAAETAATRATRTEQAAAARRTHADDTLNRARNGDGPRVRELRAERERHAPADWERLRGDAHRADIDDAERGVRRETRRAAADARRAASDHDLARNLRDEAALRSTLPTHRLAIEDGRREELRRLPPDRTGPRPDRRAGHRELRRTHDHEPPTPDTPGHNTIS